MADPNAEVSSPLFPDINKWFDARDKKMLPKRRKVEKRLYYEDVELEFPDNGPQIIHAEFMNENGEKTIVHENLSQDSWNKMVKDKSYLTIYTHGERLCEPPVVTINKAREKKGLPLLPTRVV